MRIVLAVLGGVSLTVTVPAVATSPVVFTAEVLFDEGSDVVLAERVSGLRYILRQASAIRDCPLNIGLDGNTAYTEGDSEQTRLVLARRRALAVEDWLRRAGVKIAEVLARGIEAPNPRRPSRSVEVDFMLTRCKEE